jgi:GT2 family glycosyltransferase
VQPGISIVIPSLTGDIERARASLDRQTIQGWELITISGVRPAGRARNIGVARATGELILFLDDDAELGNDRVLERMIAAMSSPDVAVVGTSKVLPATSTRLQRRIALEVPRWEFPILDVLVESNPPLDRYGFSAATTTCCLVRRTAFESVGGFDEGLTTGEDPELFYRLRKAGYRFVIPARAWAFHAPPSSMPRLLIKCFYYGVGHAQEARLDSTRRMKLLDLDRAWARLVVMLAPFLLLPMMFIDLEIEPTPRFRLAFRPVQASARLATLFGYAWGYRRAHG